MGMFKTLMVAGAGFSIALMVGEAKHPGSASETVQSTVNGVAPALSGAGFLAGDGLRATGPVIAGAKDAAQSSGLGQMLTPDTTIPAATQPDPVP